MSQFTSAIHSVNTFFFFKKVVLESMKFESLSYKNESLEAHFKAEQQLRILKRSHKSLLVSIPTR